jgi:TRAP-type mannitol/chloroaromatic compound transport system substrate-binding protein
MDDVAEQMGIKSRQLYTWKSTQVWKDEYNRLTETAKEIRTKGFKDRLQGYLNLIEKSSSGNIKTALELQDMVNKQLAHMATRLEKKDEYTLEDWKIVASMPRVISGAINDAYAALNEATGIDRVIEILDKTDG